MVLSRTVRCRLATTAGKRRAQKRRGRWGGLGERQVKTSQGGSLRRRGQKGGEPRLSNGDYPRRGSRKAGCSIVSPPRKSVRVSTAIGKDTRSSVRSFFRKTCAQARLLIRGEQSGDVESRWAKVRGFSVILALRVWRGG